LRRKRRAHTTFAETAARSHMEAFHLHNELLESRFHLVMKSNATVVAMNVTKKKNDSENGSGVVHIIIASHEQQAEARIVFA
jgi:hypothetical protein